MSLMHSPAQQQHAVDHNFDPIIYHYVKKIDIERSRTLGIDSTAICGDTSKFSNPIGGRPVNAKQGRTICPLCQLAYEGPPEKKVTPNG